MPKSSADIALQELGTFRSSETLRDGRIINQFERVYVAHMPHDVTAKPELDEVKQLRWFAPDELKAEIAKRPEKFTAGLLYGLHTYFPDFQA